MTADQRNGIRTLSRTALGAVRLTRLAGLTALAATMAVSRGVADVIVRIVSDTSGPSRPAGTIWLANTARSTLGPIFATYRT